MLLAGSILCEILLLLAQQHLMLLLCHAVLVLRLSRWVGKWCLVRAIRIALSEPLLVWPALVGPAIMPPITTALIHLRLHSSTIIARWLSHLLRTIMELIANAKVILACIDNLLQTIVVAVHLDCVRYDRLDAVIVTHYLDRANNSEQGHVMTSRCLGEHLVVMACYD